jgi:pimeloyl-ACP methyl ester carboxylesterase
MKILNSKKYGNEKSGIPLLVFHGLFGMLDNWASFGKIMGEFFPINLLDLRNHGKSFHSEDMSQNDLVLDILNYMEFYNFEKINLLGHSLGGKAVMQFAITYPKKVNKLIVVDISPGEYPPHHQGIIKALKSVDFEKITSRQEVEQILSSYITEKSVIQFLTKNLFWIQENKLAWRFNLKTLSEKYDTFVSNAVKQGVFAGETLFLAGENSNYISAEDKPKILKQFPNSSIIKISNSGHWVHADNPKDFNETVKNFIIEKNIPDTN